MPAEPHPEPDRAGTDRTADGPGDRWSRPDGVALVSSGAVLAVTTVLALRGTSSVEVDLFTRVNALPDPLEPALWLVMQLGTVGIATVVAVVAGYALRRPVLAAVFAVAPVLAWLAAKVLKDLVERGRPVAEGLAVTIRGVTDDGYGFPSGHSAVAFALATVITPHLRGRWRAVPVALATVVALARLYVGAHLPLDVVGGAALGIAVGELVRAVEVTVGGARRDR